MIQSIMLTISRFTNTLGGLWVLASLAIISRGRFKSRYWQWRTATAFPPGSSPSGTLPKLKLIIEYANWAWRMRRLR